VITSLEIEIGLVIERLGLVRIDLQGTIVAVLSGVYVAAPKTDVA
jgi:hypothetical protein